MIIKIIPVLKGTHFESDSSLIDDILVHSLFSELKNFPFKQESPKFFFGFDCNLTNLRYKLAPNLLFYTRVFTNRLLDERCKIRL